jgi:enoyl-CoA hydratase/carnithine racemase
MQQNRLVEVNMSKIVLEMEGNLACLTMKDAPLNLIGSEMVVDVTQAVGELEKMQARGLLLCADGDNFSAGADVKMFLDWTPEQAGKVLADFLDLVNRIESLPYPTMAAVQGMCLAGGLELALAFDFIWAADNAMFGQVETTIGALPYGGGAQRLAARAGMARAKEIVMGGRFYPSTEFERFGIVSRTMAASDLHAKAKKFMAKMAESGATFALDACKQIIHAYCRHGMAKADEVNKSLSPKTFETEDLYIGVNSLLKDGPGKASFKGR